MPDKQYLGFTCDEPLEKIGSLAIMTGMMTLSDEGLIIEYEIRDTILGVVKTKPRTVKFKFSELAECTYVKTWFKSFFNLKTNVFLSKKGFLNSVGNELHFKISKENAETAKSFAASLNLQISEALLNRYESK